MKKDYFSPFIILPQGRRQECVFYGSDYIKRQEYFLLKVANKFIGNTRIKTNVIRIRMHKGRIIIVHLYPTNIPESFSGRYGLKVTIGFVIDWKYLLFHYTKVLEYACNFFEAIKYSLRVNESDIYIPNVLLRSVNDYNKSMDIINALDEYKAISIDNYIKSVDNIYSRIAKTLLACKAFCYVKTENEYVFVRDRSLKKMLEKTTD